MAQSDKFGHLLTVLFKKLLMSIVITSVTFNIWINFLNEKP